MYRVLIDCRFGPGAKGAPQGFFNVKFEGGTEAEARRSAVARLKNLMPSKGFTPDEIEAATFVVDEIEPVGEFPEDLAVENGFAYYDE